MSNSLHVPHPFNFKATDFFQERNVLEIVSSEFRESPYVTVRCTYFVPGMHFQLWTLLHMIVTVWLVCVQQAISRATTLEEVERLNQMLRSGQIPSSKPSQPPESAGKACWKKYQNWHTAQFKATRGVVSPGPVGIRGALVDWLTQDDGQSLYTKLGQSVHFIFNI